MKKTARHETCSISQPPKTGPMAAVIAVNPDQVPIALPRASSLKRSADDRKTAGNQKRAAHALSRTRDDQLLDVWRESTPDGGERKHRNADRINSLAAKVIAQRTSDQQKRREKERIGFDHPLHVYHRRIQICLQRGKGDVNDRAVNKHHARTENGGGEYPGL